MRFKFKYTIQILFINILMTSSVLLSACSGNKQQPGIAEAFNPQPRSGYAMAYDANRERVVLFGGQDSSDVKLNDTWEWYENKWHKVKHAGETPSPRINAAIAYDQQEQKIILFGGIDSTGFLQDTWAYGKNGWEQMTVRNAPSPRQLATAAYDAIHHNTVLFGGRDENGDRLGDTWIFEDSEWSLAAETGPSPRSSHAMVHDDSEMSILMYGGYDGNMLSDIWLWLGGQWRQMESNEGPPRLHAAVVYDANRRGSLVIGGFGTAGRTNDVWMLKNREWIKLDMEGNLPKTRAEHEAAYVPGSGTLVFGGVVGTDPRTRIRANDTWLLNGDLWLKY